MSDKMLLSCEPICRFLDNSSHHSEFSFPDASSIRGEDALEKINDADDQDIGSFDQYLVPSSLIDRWGSAMGIQTYFMFNCYRVTSIVSSLKLTIDYGLDP